MRNEKPDEIEELERLTETYVSQSDQSEEDRKTIGDAFGRVYEMVHAHDRWLYYVLEREDVDWSWDALEKTDVSPKPRTIYDVLHEFAETLDTEKEDYEDLDRKDKEDREYLQYARRLLGLTKEASNRFMQRAKQHFGEKQLVQIVRGEYKTDIVNDVLNKLNGESADYEELLKTGKYVFRLLNKRIPKLTELDPLIQGVLQTCFDKAPFPSGRIGNRDHSCTIEIKEPNHGVKELEVDYSVALAAALYQLTKVEPSEKLINVLVRKKISGARRLRNMESINRVGNNCCIYLGPISGIDGLLGGICSSVLNER